MPVIIIARDSSTVEVNHYSEIPKSPLWDYGVGYTHAIKTLRLAHTWYCKGWAEGGSPVRVMRIRHELHWNL
jgi:hypothetical protein